ncbi:DUF7260 family protein [Salinirussus salinus]|uniref:DUF7260 family protein n=1 Tax=Salinirussus salinus TaxID=1198300 RepID=UPI0013567E8D|nr:hypothetical protein [Salinirussus salinus]
MTGTRQPHIERALDVVEAETALLRRERDAFERFLRRVGNLQVNTPATGAVGQTAPEASGAAPAQSTLITGDAPDGLEGVRTAYRETVMAVSHYDREYGESLAEHAAAELGETVAAQLVSGAAPAPVVERAVVEAAGEARDSRKELVAILERERDSLEGVKADLDDLERSVYDLGRRVPSATRSGELAAIDADLEAAEQQCTDLLNRRQELLHGRSTAVVSGVETDSLVRYLYGGLETHCPALADIAACLDSIRTHRTRCLR